jgi:hypothetical protein
MMTITTRLATSAGVDQAEHLQDRVGIVEHEDLDGELQSFLPKVNA